MGKVIRELEFDSIEDMKKFLNQEFDYSIILNQKQKNDEYKNQELRDILVNLKLEYKDDKVYLTISKLVTLKAFLLSKEQDMDIVDLVFKIDGIMNMSRGGLEKTKLGISNDDNLKEFLDESNIKSEQLERSSIKLCDNKRSVSIDSIDGSYDFNTIQPIEEF